jgi:hypothetical protein
MRIQILAAAAAAMTLAVPVAVPVAMADPAGTVPVNQIPTLRPGISVLGASSAGVLYRVERPPYMGGSQWTYLKPTGKPAYQVRTSSTTSPATRPTRGTRLTATCTT